MTGHAELADDEHVEWGTKGGGDFGGYRNTATRKSQDDGVVPTTVSGKIPGQHASSVLTIAKALMTYFQIDAFFAQGEP
jgi:hypothetical protein